MRLLVWQRKFLEKKTSRGIELSSPTCEYVINEHSSRGVYCGDTLAYVLNYPNDSGFVIISTDRRVYPVLAFSNDGSFSFENDNAKVNFIDKIGLYIDQNISDHSYEVSDSDFSSCYAVEPKVPISLGQKSPWNKYVIQNNPGCLVGCVAVATARVISQSRYMLSYHDSTFHLKSIITAINKEQYPSPYNAPKRIVGINPQPEYTYEQAVDSMARLLYLIGKDVGTEYGENASSAISSKAYSLCKQLYFSIPSGYALFDIKKITQYIKDNHIIYIDGRNVAGGYGHAWVSDACHFCVNYNDHSQIIETYIHCDWGWGGKSNGYYSGSVFETEDHSFRPTWYFAVKREW